MGMYLCYIDESGTPDVPGTSSHFVLAGLCIPIWKWKYCEKQINAIKQKYDLLNAEIHTGWLIRNYTEQNKITAFKNLNPVSRRAEVEKYRRSELFRLKKVKNGNAALKQLQKNYKKTEDYIHLTLEERRRFVLEVATEIGSWGFARLFSYCVDKVYFDPKKSANGIEEEAFEQIVSRFQYFLNTKEKNGKGSDNEDEDYYGLIIHDNNDTVKKKHTEIMKKFHMSGTFWTSINNIIETPLFVDSSLTSMIQLTDVCAYALRRYLENKEEGLLNEIMKRADRKFGASVGVRHFTEPKCVCIICQDHKYTIVPNGNNGKQQVIPE